MESLKILFIFGTRPEAIKLAPLIYKLKEMGHEVKICVTGQHRELLDQVLNFFSIVPDYDLKIMLPNQSLFHITANSLLFMEGMLEEVRPDLIIVQGDTTTSLVGALAGFYKKIKVAHIEAGLRSNKKFSPFPEEINRVLVTHLTDYHFAPTPKARESLLRENVQAGKIFVVGNTVIDALFMGLEIIKARDETQFYHYFDYLDFSKKIILVTGHRRENFGKPFENISRALGDLVHYDKDNLQIVYPLHLNPKVREHVSQVLKGMPNVHLIEPLEYPYFIWLMNKSYLILTDSGGVQEEAPSLGKPVLVLREVSERTEGIEQGTALLVGTDQKKIVESVIRLFNENEYNKMIKFQNPYGDGQASIRISNILQQVIT